MSLLFLPALWAAGRGELFGFLTLYAGDGFCFCFCSRSLSYAHVTTLGGIGNTHRCPLDGVHRVGVKCTLAAGGVIDAKHIWRHLVASRVESTNISLGQHLRLSPREPVRRGRDKELLHFWGTC